MIIIVRYCLIKACYIEIYEPTFLIRPQIDWWNSQIHAYPLRNNANDPPTVAT